MLQDLESIDKTTNHDDETFHSEFGIIDGFNAVAILNDQSTSHIFTKFDIFNDAVETTTFTFEDRYSENVFQGIMPDSGAAGVSTAGRAQTSALQRLDSTIELNTSTAGMHQIRFGKGTAISLGTVQVPTAFGSITFHVLPTNTPFLLCIQDMDRLNIKLDNLENVLIQGDKIVPVVRKWGHPWLLLNHNEQSIA